MLDLARDLQFLLHALLGPLFLQQARVFEDGGRFERQRLQQLAIAARHIRRGHARIQVEHAHGFGGGGEQAGGVALPGADTHQRNANHAAQVESGHRLLGGMAFGGARVEVHGQQFPPMLQGTMNDGARHAQIVER